MNERLSRETYRKAVRDIARGFEALGIGDTMLGSFAQSDHLPNFTLALVSAQHEARITIVPNIAPTGPLQAEVTIAVEDKDGRKEETDHVIGCRYISSTPEDR